MQSIRGSTVSTRRASEQCIQHQTSLQQSSQFSSTSLHQHQQYSTQAFTTHNSTTSSSNSSSSVVTQHQHQQQHVVSSTRSFDTFKTLNMSVGYASTNLELENLDKAFGDGVAVREGADDDDERPELPVKTRPSLLQKDVFSK